MDHSSINIRACSLSNYISVSELSMGGNITKDDIALKV